MKYGFDHVEIGDLLREFERKHKRSMSERDWDNYVIALRARSNPEIITREMKLRVLNSL